MQMVERCVCVCVVLMILSNRFVVILLTVSSCSAGAHQVDGFGVDSSQEVYSPERRVELRSVSVQYQI